TDDADAIAALRGQERHVPHDLGLGRGLAIRPDRATPGEIADRQVLDTDDDLTRPRGSAPGQSRLRQGEPARGARGFLALRLQSLQPSLVLVHLREFSMAAIALDQLLFAGDLFG